MQSKVLKGVQLMKSKLLCAVCSLYELLKGVQLMQSKVLKGVQLMQSKLLMTFGS